ncbi:MAG: diaminopimelate epimerase [Flavobacteriales bacterium]|nr:diaminopimelate epimerase [Flavobacteriales bacterium]
MATRTAFSKWHGTGNDFVVIDDRGASFPADDLALVRHLCHRHFGIGSDGLILIRAAKDTSMDYHMEFFNPDGSKSFCGNGSRCGFAFWSQPDGDLRQARFTAVDGPHLAEWRGGEVAISLGDVEAVQNHENEPNVDHIGTGSPHELVWVDEPAQVDVGREGAVRRYAPRWEPHGTNVNFLRWHEGRVEMRTYERGVEDETLSCGTGVVAAAISALHRGHARSPVEVVTPGGKLSVEADPTSLGGYAKIRLVGPVREVFKGTVDI